MSLVSEARATLEDIHYAYRLLLGRKPDTQGHEAFKRLINENPLPPRELAEYFLGSNEFRSRYNSEVVEVNLDGFVLMTRKDENDIGKTIRQTGLWEEHVTAAVRERLRSGDVFLDVGANIGYFTALAAHAVGTAGRVIAVEPMDKNLQLIYATLERNRFMNVQVHPFAAADASCVVSMGTHGGSSNGEVVREWRHSERPLYAQARRLDELLRDAGHIDVVKFDIEGYELHAWHGFELKLQSDRPIVLTEFHPRCLRENGHVEPEAYGTVLLEYGATTVLHFDGTRSACENEETLMRLWQREDAALKTDGHAHLDLLVEPRG
ncbi:MAG: FkbM family methyltransferase [Dokdonella sp.]